MIALLTKITKQVILILFINNSKIGYENNDTLIQKYL